jgi:hypothetical protein
MSTNGWKYFFQVSMDLSGSFTGASREKVFQEKFSTLELTAWLCRRTTDLAVAAASAYKYPRHYRSALIQKVRARNTANTKCRVVFMPFEKRSTEASRIITLSDWNHTVDM